MTFCITIFDGSPTYGYSHSVHITYFTNRKYFDHMHTTTKQTVYPNIVTDSENTHVNVNSSATQNYVLVRIRFILDLEDQTELVAAYFRYTYLLRAKIRYSVMMVGGVTP